MRKLVGMALNLAVCAAGLGLAGTAMATTPTTAVVEGLLLSAGGGPAADGTYQVTFALYGAETGGSAVWQEGPVALLAKNGQFSYQLGSKTPLAQAALAQGPGWLGVTVGTDPEMARRPVGAALYALRAGVAEALECSGCLKASHLDAGVLQPYAKSADLSVYAKSSDLSAYAKSSDLTAYAKSTDLSAYAKSTDLSAYAKSTDLQDYVKAASLAKVAGTGSYTDLTNTPNLAKVATSGSYSDLLNAPSLPQLKTCGTGLWFKGYNNDGSINCAALTEKDMPGDGIDEISNGLINNQFTDSTAGTTDVQIPDGLGAGKTDTLTFPDIGLAQKIWVNMTINNSDLSGVKVELYGPGISTPYVLYNGGKTGTTLTTNFNTDTPIVSGDMNADWVGKNIKGQWSITVKDLKVGGGSGGFDGKYNWSVNIQTLSNKKIQLKGDLLVDGDVQIKGVGLAGFLPGYFARAPNVAYWAGASETCCQGWKTQGNSWQQTYGNFQVTHKKRTATSLIKISWQDNVGISGANWCNVAIFIDGGLSYGPKACSGSWYGDGYGWNSHSTRSMVCAVEKLAAGNHTYAVYDRSGYCYYGNYPWDGNGGSRELIVEEIE